MERRAFQRRAFSTGLLSYVSFVRLLLIGALALLAGLVVRDLTRGDVAGGLLAAAVLVIATPGLWVRWRLRGRRRRATEEPPNPS